MTFVLAVVVIALAPASGAQDSVHLYALLERNDTTAVVSEVRRRPAAAREFLGELIHKAGRSADPQADSILVLSQRLAAGYAAAWADSFPLAKVARFKSMTRKQRTTKVIADSLRLAGNDALGTKGVSAAIRLWQSSLRHSRAIHDSAGIAATLGNIGSALYIDSRFDSAERYLRTAAHLAETIGDRRTGVNALGTLGSIAKDRGDLLSAQRAYTAALTIRTRIGDVEGESADQNNLGLVSAALGDGGEARKHYSEALRIARDNELDAAAATALLNLGNVAAADADYSAATKNYTEALALSRRVDDQASSALALHNLGLLALRTGEYSKARTRLKEALSLFTRVGTREDLVRVRTDLAAVATAMGELQQAITDLRIANRLVAQLPRSFDLAATVALARADLATELNDISLAQREYAEAQRLFRRAGNSVGEISARQGSAALLVSREQYSAAASQLEAAMRINISNGDRRSAALARLDLGRVRLQAGDTALARRLIVQSASALAALGDPVAEAASILAVGELEMSENALAAAETQYRKGLATIGSRRAPAVTWQLRSGLARALHARGAAGEATSQLSLAIADVERVTRQLSVGERRSVYLADKWEPYSALALIQYERGDAASAFAVSERMRGRQMLDLLARGAIAHSQATDTSLVARERELRSRVAGLTRRLEPTGGTLSLRGPGPANRYDDTGRQALAEAQDEYERVLVELSESTTGSGGVAAISDWRSVANRLAADQAMLEYLVTDSTTLVFVVKRDTIQALDLGIGTSALAPLIDFARAALVTRSPASGRISWRAPMRRLYAQLIAPIEDAGALDHIRQLIIVPHAQLHYLPFAALVRSGNRDEFLIERYDVGYAPSATMWLRLGERGSMSARQVLALAPRAGSLPGSRAEVEAIRALYRSDAAVLTNGAATETAFRTQADSFGILHLATNGVLNRRNPLFSFVEMSSGDGDDGRLEVHEVFGLTLHARLLVLSACQTALASGAVSDVPPGDDWVGLVRAFLSAGAQNVVATLWPVEDRSTAQLMERLHVRLRAGDSETTALSRAQRETLRNSATSGPFYWAGFVNVGGAAGK